MGSEPDNFLAIDFEETELRLGLPGGKCGGGSNEPEALRGAGGGNGSGYGKRGFMETVDLKLKLSSKDSAAADKAEIKMKEKTAVVAPAASDPDKPPSKAQVVGWPPVRSFRKNIMAGQKSGSDEPDKAATGGGGVAFVKVSMDGAPYLRKVDLKLYKSYQELSDALANMFRSFTIGNCGSQGMKNFMNERKLIDLLNGSDYVPTYEDKDGDWMLDVCRFVQAPEDNERIRGYRTRTKSSGEVQKQKLNESVRRSGGFCHEHHPGSNSFSFSFGLHHRASHRLSPMPQLRLHVLRIIP